MKRMMIFFLIASASVTINAQHFNVTIRDELKNSDYSSSDDVKFGNRYYFLDDVAKRLTTTRRIVVGQKDDYSGIALKSSKTELELFMPRELKLMKTGGKLFVVYQVRDRNLRTASNLMAAEVDTFTIEMGIPRVIADLSKNGYDTKPGTGWESQDRNYFERSPDSTKLLFFIANEKSASQIYISVTDPMLNVLWERVADLGRPSSEISIKNAVIDNSGNVYVAYKMVDSRKTKYAAGETNHFAVYGSNKKIIDQTLDIGDGRMKEVALKISANKNALFFGGYFFTEDYNYLQGAFSGYLSLNDHKFSDVKTELFPAKIIAELDNDGWASTSKKKYGVMSYILPRIVNFSDGSYGIIGEFRRITDGEKASYMIAGSILYVNLTGKPVFARIPKARVSAGTSFGDSYSAFAVADKAIVFYNDRESSLQKDISESANRSDVYKNVILAGVIIDANGEVRREKVIDLSAEDYMAVSHKIIREKENVFLVSFLKVRTLGGFKHDSKFARIEFK